MSHATTRVHIQWPPQESYENTDTLVLVTPKSTFVDIRVLKDHKESSSEFPVDWVLTGTEVSLPNDKVDFQYEIESSAPNKRGTNDICDFVALADGDFKESGEIPHPDTGKVQPFVEIWRNIDPVKSSPGSYVKAHASSYENVPSAALKINSKEYLGTVVRLGNFLQGALLNIKSNELSVLRAHRNTDGWNLLFAYGPDAAKIPIEIKQDDLAIVNWDGLPWSVEENNI